MRTFAGLWIVVVVCAVSSSAAAATTCTFSQVGSVLRLDGDCETDATLLIPEGATLDGGGFRITAVDPAGTHFVGAVVKNAGAHASVRDLTIDTRGLVAVCNPSGPPDLRLRGILLESASGSITGNRVLNVSQGGSGCQEGEGIEVHSAPFDGTHPATRRVSVTGNFVSAYQKTGILVNGDVEVAVLRNRTVGLGAVDFIAQNGIQLGYGAYGRVQGNRVEQNVYSPGTFASSGILLLEADSGVDLIGNVIESCDVGIYVQSSSEALLRDNRVTSSTAAGIVIDGLDGLAQGNVAVANVLDDDAVGIDIIGDGADHNDLERNQLTDHAIVGIQVAFGASDNALVRNQVLRSGQYGLWIGTDDNTVRRNVVTGSGTLDIQNTGASSYSGNRCDSSSGSPVDCPAP